MLVGFLREQIRKDVSIARLAIHLHRREPATHRSEQPPPGPCLLAYVATGASVAAGALYYANVLMSQFFSWTPPPAVTLTLIVLITSATALRDVKLSAELMLWIEVISSA